MLFQEFLILIPLTTLTSLNGSDSTTTTTTSSGLSDSEDPDPDGLVPPLAYAPNVTSSGNCTTTLDPTTQTRITWCNDAADTVDSSAVLGNFTVDDLEEELEERHNVSKRLIKLEDSVVFEGPTLYDEEEFFEEEEQQD